MSDPRQVREGRDRMLAGDRLGGYELQARPYFCRACSIEQRSVLVPRGWYALVRATGTLESKPARLGLYCSARCLETRMDRLIGIEDDLGDAFDSIPSEFRQQRSR